MDQEPRRQRPEIAAGYGIHGGEPGMLLWDHAVAQLTTARNYWVVTANQKGTPHAIPVWGLWLDGAVWFSSDPESRKVRNLLARPEVIVHLESGDDVVIIHGTASRVPGTEALAEFRPAYKAKYGWDVDISDPRFALFRVKPRRVLAWLEADYPATATAFEPAASQGNS